MHSTEQRPITLALTGEKKSGKSALVNELLAIEPDSVHLQSGLTVMGVANAWVPQFAAMDRLEHAPDSELLEIANTWLRCLPPVASHITGKDVGYQALEISAQTQGSPAVTRLFDYLKDLRFKPELNDSIINPQNKDQYRALLEFLGGYLYERVDEGVWYDVLTDDAQTEKEKGKRLINIDGLRFSGDELRCRRVGAYIVRVVRSSVTSTGTVTEQSKRNIKEDIRVHNEGTIAGLGQVAEALLDDVRHGMVVIGTREPKQYRSG